MATDAFTGTGALSANWTQQYGSTPISRSSDVAVSGASLPAAAFYSGATWANDQTSECIRPTIAAYAGPTVRASSSGATVNHYRVQGNGSLELIIIKMVAGAETFLQFTGEIPSDTDDIIRISVTGTTVRAFNNGVQRGTDQVDTSLASGSAGIYIEGDSDSLDNWSGTGDAGGTAYFRTLDGTIVPVGALALQIRRTLAGGITPAGALVTQKVLLRAFTGGITPTGTIARVARRAFGGAVAPTGTVSKRPNIGLGGNVTPTATVNRRSAISLSGGVTPAGVLGTTKVILVALTGALATIAGSLSWLWIEGTPPSPLVGMFNWFRRRGRRG